MWSFFATRLCGFFTCCCGIPLGTTRWHCGNIEGGPGPGEGEEVWDPAIPRTPGAGQAWAPTALLKEDLPTPSPFPAPTGGGGPSQEVISV